VLRYKNYRAEPRYLLARARRALAPLCVTPAHDGQSKGVVYSHRSTFLHSLAQCAAGVFGLTEHDRILPIVRCSREPWGLLMVMVRGSTSSCPTPFFKPSRYAAYDEERLFSGAVPRSGMKCSATPRQIRSTCHRCEWSLRRLTCPSLMEDSSSVRRKDHSAWGMTETTRLRRSHIHLKMLREN